MFSRIRKLEKGYTLLELIMAVAILAILMVPTTMMVFSGMRFYQNSCEHKRAAELLNWAYERALAQDLNNMGESETDDGYRIKYIPQEGISQITYEVPNNKWDFSIMLIFNEDNYRLKIRKGEGESSELVGSKEDNIIIAVEQESDKMIYDIRVGDEKNSVHVQRSASAFGILIISEATIPDDLAVIVNCFPGDISKTFSVYALGDIKKHIISNSPYVVIKSVQNLDDKSRADEQKSLRIVVKNRRGEVLRDEVFFYKKSKILEGP